MEALTLVLLLDTSSAESTIALLERGTVVAERSAPSGRGFDAAGLALEVLGGRAAGLTGVAVAIGPGSFTGLRSGVSFGVGLARGLGIPLHALGTLELVAARALEAATALSEAGRGRLFYLAPDGGRGVGEPEALPTAWPLVGSTRPATQARLLAAGHSLLPGPATRSIAAAAAGLLEGSQPVAYGRVRPVYMSSFGGLAP